MILEFEELNELRLTYLRPDGSYDAGILVLASRYAQMAAIRRDDVERLTAEVKWLQDYGRIPQLEALLRDVGPCVRHCDQHAASLAGRIDAAVGPTEYTVHHPSYVAPPADPLLAKPEKHR